LCLFLRKIAEPQEEKLKSPTTRAQRTETSNQKKLEVCKSLLRMKEQDHSSSSKANSTTKDLSKYLEKKYQILDSKSNSKND
jgi:hypothetical protein